MDDSIQNLRVEYAAGVREEAVNPDPLRQFAAWFNDARQAEILEPNAMTLATVDEAGHPQARIVLLKGFDERGFVFYTNYESAEPRDLAAHPQAALVFYWDRLERSVRITGTVEKTSRAESQAYFATRPYRSQLGAWVSRQSSVVASRQVLEDRFAELAATYPQGQVPCPPHWGGYRVKPDRYEFWQGQRSRLHDRLRYTAQHDGTWKIERLNP